MLFCDTVIPSTVKAAACLPAPPGPLCVQVSAVQIVLDVTGQESQFGLPLTDASFRVDDALPRYRVTIVHTLWLIACIRELLQARSNLSAHFDQLLVVSTSCCVIPTEDTPLHIDIS